MLLHSPPSIYGDLKLIRLIDLRALAQGLRVQIPHQLEFLEQGQEQEPKCELWEILILNPIKKECQLGQAKYGELCTFFLVWILGWFSDILIVKNDMQVNLTG